MTLHEFRVMARAKQDEPLDLRPDDIEHQLHAGGARFSFGTALEPVGHRRFRRLLTPPETVP